MSIEVYETERDRQTERERESARERERERNLSGRERKQEEGGTEGEKVCVCVCVCVSVPTTPEVFDTPRKRWKLQRSKKRRVTGYSRAEAMPMRFPCMFFFLQGQTCSMCSSNVSADTVTMAYALRLFALLFFCLAGKVF